MEQSNERSQAGEVTLFVVPHCPLCADARRWLTSHRVEFVERDVAADFGALRAMYGLTRQRLVPVVAKGDRALVRPSEAELTRLVTTPDQTAQ